MAPRTAALHLKACSTWSRCFRRQLAWMLHKGSMGRPPCATHSLRYVSVHVLGREAAWTLGRSMGCPPTMRNAAAHANVCCMLWLQSSRTGRVMLARETEFPPVFLVFSPWPQHTSSIFLWDLSQQPSGPASCPVSCFLLHSWGLAAARPHVVFLLFHGWGAAPCSCLVLKCCD